MNKNMDNKDELIKKQEELIQLYKGRGCRKRRVITDALEVNLRKQIAQKDHPAFFEGMAFGWLLMGVVAIAIKLIF